MTKKTTAALADDPAYIAACATRDRLAAELAKADAELERLTNLQRAGQQIERDPVAHALALAEGVDADPDLRLQRERAMALRNALEAGLRAAQTEAGRVADAASRAYMRSRTTDVVAALDVHIAALAAVAESGRPFEAIAVEAAALGFDANEGGLPIWAYVSTRNYARDLLPELQRTRDALADSLDTTLDGQTAKVRALAAFDGAAAGDVVKLPLRQARQLIRDRQAEAA